MAHIVAIGGGSMVERESEKIDLEIFKLSNKKKPKALFIPTASSEDETYRKNFRIVYGERMGCEVKELLILKDPPSKQNIQILLNWADIIYVGGGNTLKMMRRWRVLGIDKMLISIFNKTDKILCGSSAGALCWFQYGHSDSMAYYHPKKWDYIRVKSLGIIPVLLCPHYLKENRDMSYKAMIKKIGGIGLALDNAAAIHIYKNKYRIITSNKNAKAYKLIKKNGQVVETEIEQSKTFKELIPLLQY